MTERERFYEEQIIVPPCHMGVVVFSLGPPEGYENLLVAVIELASRFANRLYKALGRLVGETLLDSVCNARRGRGSTRNVDHHAISNRTRQVDLVSDIGQQGTRTWTV